MAKTDEIYDIETFLLVEENRAHMRLLALAASRTTPIAESSDDPEDDESWARQLHSTRACSQTK